MANKMRKEEVLMSSGHRQFTIMQYEENPKTGEDLHFGETNIIQGVAHKSIKKYSYALHDKDIKTKETESHPSINIGNLINRHWHICIKTESAVEIATIATWFGVPENFVEVKHDANAYISCVEYLTHESEKEQLAGKHRYDDSEIKSNHNWRAELTKYQIRRIKKGASKLNTKDYYRNEVLYCGRTINQVIDEDADAYRNDFATLDKLRLSYLQKFAEIPKTRINYYVSGLGGSGKGLISRALAKSLYSNLKRDDEIFFQVGADNTTFEGYDGQPVIIWNDFRALTLITALKGRENVFNVFDTHPTDQRQNVKFSSIRLTNTVNIVNSVDSYSDFLDGLAGEYTDKNGIHRHAEDKGQSYRRFPIIIPLHEEDFDILINKGVLEGNSEFDQFIEHTHFRGNLEQLNRRLNGHETEIAKLEAKMVSPIVGYHKVVYQGMVGCENNDKKLTDIVDEFKDYGNQNLEAIRYDEERKQMEEEARIIQQQNYEVQRILYYSKSSDNEKQKAIQISDLIKKDPQWFVTHPELHLPVSELNGAYLI